jgi:hypothetical protein
MTNRAAVGLSVIGWATCLLLSKFQNLLPHSRDTYPYLMIHSHDLLISRAATIGPLAIQTPERGPFYGVAGAWLVMLMSL